MNAILKCGDRTIQELLDLVDHLQRPDSAPQLRCWIEAPDGWSFDWWRGLTAQITWYRAASLPATLHATDAVQNSMAGRLFAPDGELRWRHIPALGSCCYRCLFLGQTDWVGSSLEDRSSLLHGLKQQTATALLWGQQSDISDGEWIELRIPHRFKYPIQGNPRGVLIQTELWLDAARQDHFVRLCDMHPYQETR